MTKKRPTAIELFCGAGGMTLGFEQAGFEVVAAFDLEQFNVETHKVNFPDTKVFCVDLSEQSGDSLRELADFTDGEVDLVFGGPPCQGFSFGGYQDVDDERNLLVYDFARIVRQLKPAYFVMENVKGLMSVHARPIRESFVRRIKKAGYKVVEPIRVLNAADYGVPQRRWRTFILGYRKDATPIAYPDPRACLDEKGEPFHPVVGDAIGDLPILEDHDALFDSDAFTKKLIKTDNVYARLMRRELIASDDKSKPRKTEACGLTGCLRTKHSNETVRRFRKTKQGAAEPVSRYIRLAWNDVAPTIRAGTGVEHGSHTAPRPIHPKLPRCICAREAARLHSIPDWFQFHGTRWHDFRQIGNSVPPLLAKAVAAQIAAQVSFNKAGQCPPSRKSKQSLPKRSSSRC